MSNVAVTMDVSFHGRCLKHPKFNPARDGDAGIKGGCNSCLLLLDLYRRFLVLEAQLHQLVDNPAVAPAPGAAAAAGRR